MAIQSVTGPSSSQTPYLVASDAHVTIESLITTGDAAGGYRMVGIPDGLGAFDNGNGTFTLLMNHEISTSNPSLSGVVRAHGANGAFVSEWVIDKTTLQVLSGHDLMHDVWTFDTVSQSYVDHSAALGNGFSFSRFCSADLADPSAFFNPQTGLGLDPSSGRLYLNGEENNAESKPMAHIVGGAQDGNSFELAWLGNMAYENLVANPSTGDKTVVGMMNDTAAAGNSGDGSTFTGNDRGEVYFYVGDKKATGLAIDKAGLTGGGMFGVKVAGMEFETDLTTKAVSGSRFDLVPVGNAGSSDVHNLTGAQIETNSQTVHATSFERPEDGAWDTLDPNKFYFVTTASITGHSKLWELDFTDAKNPTLGGTAKMLLDGTEGQLMFDNITVSADGKITLLEDPGNADRVAKVWQYDPSKGSLTEIAQHDPLRFDPNLNGPGVPGPNFITKDEESSGVIDVSKLLGNANDHVYLVDTQAHNEIGGDLVEGGQLMLMHVRANTADDFSGDGNGDILWRKADGSVSLWQMNGPQVSAGQNVGTAGTDWRISGTPDINGDGRTDVLWRNNNTGAVSAWQVNGSQVVSGQSIGTVGTDWVIAGTPDIDGDGKGDVLWRNPTSGAVSGWELNGFQIKAAQSIGTVGPDWQVAGTGDFDGDSKGDVLWRNPTSGAVSMWELNGFQVKAGQSVGTVGPDWRVAGTGDFNGDGKADVLWRNSNTGAVSMWQMNGFTVSSAPSVGTIGLDWVIAETADLNGDGKTDVVWRNPTSGATSVWQMNGATITQAQSIGTVGPDWNIVGQPTASGTPSGGDAGASTSAASNTGADASGGSAVPSMAADAPTTVAAAAAAGGTSAPSGANVSEPSASVGYTTVSGGLGGMNSADDGSGGSGSSTVAGGAGDHPAAAGSQSEFVLAGGVTVWGAAGVSGAAGQAGGNATVTGFGQSGDGGISFPNETAAAVNQVITSARTTDGNTLVTLPDGSTLTLAGVTHIDSTMLR